MNRRLLALALTLFSVGAYAQSKGESSISQYLDDGGRTKSKNLIKTEISQYYQGEIPIIWEHLFGKQFSIEAGAGVLLPFYNDGFFNQMADNGKSTFDKPNLGYSLYFAPRVYLLFGDDAWSPFPTKYPGGFESPYISFPFRMRHYPGQIIFYDGAITIGKQWIFNNRLVVDFSAGFGLNFQHSLDDKTYAFDAEGRISYDVPNLILPDEYPQKARITIPISLKVGYRF